MMESALHDPIRSDGMGWTGIHPPFPALFQVSHD